MDKISKLALLHAKLIENKSIIVKASIIRDFCLFCKMAGTKTTVEIYVNDYFCTIE